MISGLDHIQVAMPVGLEEVAREFYGRILQMTEIEKTDELKPKGGCWFQAGMAQLHVGTTADFVPASKAHPAFLVDDLNALQTRLSSAGIVVLPDTAAAGVRRFYVNDPFGNRLEFIHHGDGFNLGVGDQGSGVGE